MKTKEMSTILVVVLALAGSASAELVAHYEFEGNANDSAGINHGTEVDNPTYGPGVFGQAINLDGVADYVDCGSDVSLDITDAVTLAMWVKTDDSGNNENSPYVGKGNTSYAIKHKNNNNIEFFIYDDTWYYVWLPVDSSFNGFWHHLAGTYDGSELKLYVDGELAASTPHIGFIASNAFNVNIGRNSEMHDRFYDGVMDDVRIYNHALSPEDIRLLVDVNGFTYQGRLLDDNAIADGFYDFEFKLYDGLTDGNQIASTLDMNDVDVIEGYFTVELDFGNEIFDGDDRCLEIGVRPGDSDGGFTTLSPRQELTPTPHSFYAGMAGGINMPEGAQEGFVLTSDANGLGSWQSSGGGINGHSHHSLDADDGSPTEAVYVDSIGNVGIGTMNPNASLHVAGGGEHTFEVFIGSSWNEGNKRLGLGATNGSAGLSLFEEKVGGYLIENDAGDLTFKAGYTGAGGEKVRITSDGNVGIGTTDPLYKLDIRDGDLALLTDDASKGFRLQLRSGGEFDEGGFPDFNIRSHRTGRNCFTIDEDSGNVGIWYANPGTARLSVNGNVGIGTTNPGAPLDIHSGWSRITQMYAPNGNIDFTDTMIKFESLITNAAPQLWLVDQDNRNDRAIIHAQGNAGAVEALWVSSSGNVGIGTTNPGAKLEVNGQVKITGGSPGTGKVLTSNSSGLASWQPAAMVSEIDPTVLASVKDGVSWGEVSGIPSGFADGIDNVGTGGDNLGNHTATENIKLNEHYLSGDGGNEGVYVDSAGRVGIGTDTPTHKLEVRDNSSIPAILARNEGSGIGVYGESSGYYGVYGNCDDGYGVYGSSDSGWGVYGSSAGGYGVYGSSGHDIGVYGHSAGAGQAAIKGDASGAVGCGVLGIAKTGTGVRGEGGIYDFYAAGSGINYFPFTGAHEVKLTEDSPADIESGMIVSVTGQTQTRYNKKGQVSVSSTMPTVKLSDVARDKAVFGAFVAEVPLPQDHWYEASEAERFAAVNALGEGRAWVCNINGEIEAGDYITTSTVPGYGQRQDDDLLHSYTLAKAIETVDWDSVTQTVEFKGQSVKVYLIAVVYTSG